METQAEPIESPPPAARGSELKTRVISALVLSSVVLMLLMAGGMWFIALVLVAALLMLREWDLLAEGQGAKWKHAGIPYVAVPCATLIWLRGIQMFDAPHTGMLLCLYLIFVVCATDIGAYFAGRQFGGPKLAPRISPKKTWAGLIGGAAAAAMISVLCLSFTPYPGSFLGAIAVGIALAVISQGGDLFESWLKRRAGVKDSGAIIPGHGGVLDRVDGLVAAAPAYGLLVALAGLGM